MREIVRFIKDLSLYGLEKVAGLYYSKYRGFVADNADPKGYGRIKLSVPDVYGDAVFNYWAYPANCYSGKNYGVQVIPQIDDLVWVEFERGNPKKPIWSYGHFGKEEKDELPDELKDIKSFWFKTPGGHLIQFNDTTGLITIMKEGTDIEPQFAVLGETHNEQWEELLDILIAAKTNTQLGPQNFMPTTLQKLQELKGKKEELKSQVFKHN